ncbi:glycosyltransferase [Luteimonas salinilitoris]|uniref:Glycosyltransferase n=1 Tax=Luteimonas salinilitoris TaxID=3237697 RepID=A0ABV4HNS0_9GAMM
MKPPCVPLECASFVVPVFNEQANLPELIQRCLKVGHALPGDFELVLVDDGSTDDSARIIAAAAERKPGHVVGVLLNRNYGQHAAVTAGLAQARGDIIVTLDADLQNPPEEIPKLLAGIERGCDVVAGVRQRRQDSRVRVVASRIMNRLMRRMTGVGVGDYGCMQRAYRRDIVDAILACNERSVYIPALGNSFAGNIGEVTVEHAERRAGKSKYRLWSLLNLYFDLLVSTTTAPLRMLSMLGTLSALAGVGLGVLLIVLRLVYGPEWAAQGMFTIFALVFWFLGVQLIGMGLLGEYIGRISRDVQGRPRFIVRKVVGAQARPVARVSEAHRPETPIADRADATEADAMGADAIGAGR